MACEKCWRDACARQMYLGGSVSDHYRDLMVERLHQPCTLEEQRGIETKVDDENKPLPPSAVMDGRD